MKYLITVLLAFIALADSTDILPLNEEAQARIANVSKECIHSSSVPQAVLDQMRTGTFTEDDTLKEYFFCAFKKMGWQDDTGKFLIEQATKDFLPDKVFPEVATKCLETKEAKGPQIAYDFFKCFCTNLPKGYKATF